LSWGGNSIDGWQNSINFAKRQHLHCFKHVLLYWKIVESCLGSFKTSGVAALSAIKTKHKTPEIQAGLTGKFTRLVTGGQPCATL